MRSNGMVFAALLAVTGGAPRATEACSLPTPISQGGILPANGAVDVPTNVRIKLLYGGHYAGPELYDVIVRPSGGEPVLVDVIPRRYESYWNTTAHVTPRAPLLPMTTYEVLSRVSAEPCLLDCISAAHSVVATFTTGTGTADIVPAFAPSFTYEYGRDTCEHDACCGPYDVVTMTARWQAATGGRAPIEYQILGPSSDEPLVTVLATTTYGQQWCPTYPGGSWVQTWEHFTYQPGLRLRAVDVAGNPSPAFPLDFVPPACEQASGPDAAPGPDDPGPPSGGCASGGDSRRGAGLVLLVGLALVLAARGRNRAARIRRAVRAKLGSTPGVPKR